MSDIAAGTPSLIAPSRAGLGTVYLTLLRWELTKIGGTLLPLVVIVQALLAAGIIVGFGFLIPNIDTATATFLSTGAPTVLLVIVGLVIVPQGVARDRADGTFAYVRALPVARPLLLVADLTVWLLVALPSVVIAVLVAWWRYGIAFDFAWPTLLASAVLIAVTSTAVGYAIAVSMPPLLAQLVSQVLVFFVLLFSPITFPASQLPAWFQTVHQILPIQPAADLLRAGLVSGTYSASLRDLLVLLAWCVAGLAISITALVRRA